MENGPSDHHHMRLSAMGLILSLDCQHRIESIFASKISKSSCWTFQPGRRFPWISWHSLLEILCDSLPDTLLHFPSLAIGWEGHPGTMPDCDCFGYGLSTNTRGRTMQKSADCAFFLLRSRLRAASTLGICRRFPCRAAYGGHIWAPWPSIGSHRKWIAEVWRDWMEDKILLYSEVNRLLAVGILWYHWHVWSY